MIYELVLRNFDCSLEFAFSLLLLQPFNFSPVSFACNFQDWGCVILREIDFLLKICWSIPCLHPSWKVHTLLRKAFSRCKAVFPALPQTPISYWIGDDYKLKRVDAEKLIQTLVVWLMFAAVMLSNCGAEIVELVLQIHSWPLKQALGSSLQFVHKSPSVQYSVLGWTCNIHYVSACLLMLISISEVFAENVHKAVASKISRLAGSGAHSLVCYSRPVSKFWGLRGKSIFRGRIFVFIICLKQIFLVTTKFGT